MKSFLFLVKKKDMLSFTLRHCEYFEAVARHGGIAQAARALGISQPAVAQGLDRLEELTGLTLFHRRHARGADLTVQGRAFRRATAKLLATAGEVEREAVSLAANLAGLLRLGCFHTLAPFCLAALVRDYRRQRPNAILETSEDRHEILISQLKSGLMDLAILYNMDLADEALHLTQLACLPPRVLLSADHPLANESSIWLQELAGQPFILFDGAGSSAYFRGIIAAHGLNCPVVMRCQSMESVRSAVGNGLGFSFTGMRTASDLSHDGHRFVSLPIADDVATLDVVLACREDTRDSALVGDFSEFCRQLFRQLI